MHGYFITCTCQCLGLFDYMYYDSCISMCCLYSVGSPGRSWHKQDYIRVVEQQWGEADQNHGGERRAGSTPATGGDEPALGQSDDQVHGDQVRTVYCGRIKIYCTCVVKSKENTSIFVCINFHRLNKNHSFKDM